MEILQRIAKEIDVWIYIENDIITFDEIFSPEVFKFEFQSESGYKYKLEHVCWIVVDLFSFTPAGDFITVELFIADKITQERYGKGYFEYKIDETIEVYNYFIEFFEALNYLIKEDELYEGW